MDKETYVIAEAGVNHNGDIKTAFKLIDAAVYARANAIKFQTYKTDNLVLWNTKKAPHQSRSRESTQYDMLKQLELSFSEFRQLKAYSDYKTIDFISSPYDIESLNFLVDELRVSQIKIPSAEIVNLPLIQMAARSKLPIILSTGMANMVEIHEAITWISDNSSSPITLLHCVSDYPTDYSIINMNRMIQLKKLFSLPIGYSDHTLDIDIPIAAVALGAEVIEKHITLSRMDDGPDHFCSIEPKKFRDMVISIRNVEKARVSDDYCSANIEHLRRSITAVRDIEIGEFFTRFNIKLLRPATGMAPKHYYNVLGRVARRSIKKGEKITLSDF